MAKRMIIDLPIARMFRERVNCLGRNVLMRLAVTELYQWGAIDLVAVTTARMIGWKTQSFFEKTSTHHKKSQSFAYMTIAQVFRSGYVDYLIGGDLTWQALRAVNQIRRPRLALFGEWLFSLDSSGDVLPASANRFSKQFVMVSSARATAAVV
jgi:hypothetical protein